MAEKYEIKDFIEFEPEISEEWQKLKVKFKHSVGEFKYLHICLTNTLLYALITYERISYDLS
jgi:hypothetical protein